MPCVFLAVTAAGINLSIKSDVTKRRSRPYKLHADVTCLVDQLGAIDIKHFVKVSYCQRRFFFFQPSGGMQRAKITLTSFLPTSGHGVPVIKRENFILFDVFFSRHYDTAK